MNIFYIIDYIVITAVLFDFICVSYIIIGPLRFHATTLCLNILIFLTYTASLLGSLSKVLVSTPQNLTTVQVLAVPFTSVIGALLIIPRRIVLAKWVVVGIASGGEGAIIEVIVMGFFASTTRHHGSIAFVLKIISILCTIGTFCIPLAIVHRAVYIMPIILHVTTLLSLVDQNLFK